MSVLFTLANSKIDGIYLMCASFLAFSFAICCFPFVERNDIGNIRTFEFEINEKQLKISDVNGLFVNELFLQIDLVNIHHFEMNENGIFVIRTNDGKSMGNDLLKRMFQNGPRQYWKNQIGSTFLLRRSFKQFQRKFLEACFLLNEFVGIKGMPRTPNGWKAFQNDMNLKFNETKQKGQEKSDVESEGGTGVCVCVCGWVGVY
jgi:hypothetical protein